jgi:hypothetical protein
MVNGKRVTYTGWLCGGYFEFDPETGEMRNQDGDPEATGYYLYTNCAEHHWEIYEEPPPKETSLLEAMEEAGEDGIIKMAESTGPGYRIEFSRLVGGDPCLSMHKLRSKWVVVKKGGEG